jgi:uncharacterized protein (TIGR00251 family)
MSTTTKLAVKIVPNSHQNEIVGWEANELKIRLKPPPHKGEANKELVEFLSEVLYVPKSHISIVKGKSSPHKQVHLMGVSQDTLDKRLPPKNAAQIITHPQKL